MTQKITYRDGKPVAIGVAPRFDEMAADFEKKFGMSLHVASGVRSRAEQEVLYKRYLAGGTLAAKPGTSRHETGRALDIYDSGTTPGVTRAGNPRSNWIRENAHRYGFVANGYTFPQVEPWHIEYTGDPWEKPFPVPAKGARRVTRATGLKLTPGGAHLRVAKKGTTVNVSEVRKVKGRWWGKTPHGWIRLRHTTRIHPKGK